MLTRRSPTPEQEPRISRRDDDYLVKPFENTELRARVGWLLAALVSHRA